MPRISRRRLLGWLTAVGGAYGLGLATPRLISLMEGAPLRRAINSILPSKPISTGLGFGDSIPRLVEAGAIDREKFLESHERRGPVPEWVSRTLDGKPQELILSVENAPYNLNLLWPLGLATKTAFNDDSPILGDDLPNFASTGGWTLGRENNGATYFNAVETLALTPSQSDTVHRLAGNVFRPCCGNSTFFQDCNHGSAMLGLMELAAARGRNPAEILSLAKTANGFWFPQQYVELALFFDAVEGYSWDEAPADRILSAEFSSGRGWRENVHAALIGDGIVVQRTDNGGGSGCAV